MQCNAPHLPEAGISGVSPMCVTCILMFWPSCICLQYSQLQCLSLCLLCQGLVLVLLMGKSGATLALSLVKAGIYLNCGRTDLQGTPPILSTEWFLLVGRACSQTISIPPSHCKVTVELVCVVIFPSTQVWSHFGVVLTLVGAICTLPTL